MSQSYKDALKTLNSLQNAGQEKGAEKIQKMKTLIVRSGINENKLRDLSIIHVSGTKGKGSTCALAESILRHHGYKTGFYSSPHLIEVVERIKINGESIDKRVFSKYFFEIYDNIIVTDYSNLPGYFQMLTLIALKSFLEENVDVAIIEVGIGGEYDATNVFKNVSVVGITSLGIDHVGQLGTTIDSIAWHKSGIMKKGCPAFTTAQVREAIDVLNQRSLEKECTLRIVEDVLKKYMIDYNKMPNNFDNLNLSLAVSLCLAWLKKTDETNISEFVNSNETLNGIVNCELRGRFQKLIINNLNYYLDGAHTFESINYCLNWFKEATKSSENKRILIFNSTGNRDVATHIEILQKCYFNKVIFAPNIPTDDKMVEDFVYSSKSIEIQLNKCENHKSVWLELMDKSTIQEILTFPTIEAALNTLYDDHYDILITGSMHLVGCVLFLIDNYKYSSK